MGFFKNFNPVQVLGGAAAILAGGALGGISYLVQSKQQKIAAQKQQDAIDKAAADQVRLLDEQKLADNLRKKERGKRAYGGIY